MILILLIYTSIILQSFARFPVPENGNITICFDLPCLTASIQYISQNLSHVIVACASSDIQNDNYLSLYLGNLIESFSLSSNLLHYLLFQSMDNSFYETVIMYLTLLPERSVFISFEDGSSSFGIHNTAITKNNLGE